MKLRHTRTALFIGLALSVAATLALTSQDKYSLKVPGGLAFSEFRGYEAWQTISVSRNENAIAVILGNPVMIDAYRAGFPGNREAVPDGAKMAKIHWTPKSNDFFKNASVPSTLENVDFMVKDSRRFADSGGWGYAVFDYDAASETFKPEPQPVSHRRDTTPSAGLPATRQRRIEITFSPTTAAGEEVWGGGVWTCRSIPFGRLIGALAMALPRYRIHP